MLYAIIAYPTIKDSSQIQIIREKYDPQFHLIDPHITIVFPFTAIDKDSLITHIDKILEKHIAFDITLNEVQCSFDNHLFLLTNQGSDEIIKLYNELYTGILAGYLRKEIPFIPHITLGAFKAEQECRDIKDKVAEKFLTMSGLVNFIDLIAIDDNYSKVETIKRFKLE